MSSDPKDVLDALEWAQDAFEGVGLGIPALEEGIAEGGGWETQLTKACKLLEVVDVLRAENGYYTAVIELSFGVIERSIEAYLVRMAGHDVEEPEDRLELGVHEERRERVEGHPGPLDVRVGEPAELLGDADPDASEVGGGRDVLHPVGRERAPALPLGDAVDEPYVRRELPHLLFDRVDDAARVVVRRDEEGAVARLDALGDQREEEVVLPGHRRPRQ